MVEKVEIATMSQPRGRKIAFSTKQKKAQIQQKRDRKRRENSANYNDLKEQLPSQPSPFVTSVMKNESQVKQLPSIVQKDKNRYLLIFKKETDEDVKKGKEESNLPVHQMSEEEKEVRYSDFIPKNAELGIPKRPQWNYNLGKQQLEKNERKYFEEYMNNIEVKYGKEALNFDLNLENWRQLWRVIEMSDIILFIVDVRCPLHLFSPALFEFVTRDLKKQMVLVMNKIDLMPASLILAWKEFMESNFPGLRVIYFSSYVYVHHKTQKQGCQRKVQLSIPGSRELLKICENIVSGKVDLSSWQEKIDQEAVKQGQTEELFDDILEECEEEDDNVDLNMFKKTAATNIDTSHYHKDPYFNGILTLGCVGNPNVGKSAFLNAIIGKKVVSVSKTPGHTKHFQTIFVTPTVKICDCPGLVFPSFHSKALQAIIGSFPIANLRNPFSSVRLLFQRVPIHEIFKLKHPRTMDEGYNDIDTEWSTYDLCQALALKKGYLTAKASRPDMFRAAKYLLRLALDGREISMYFYPSQYTAQKEKWNSHEHICDIQKLQQDASLGLTDASHSANKQISCGVFVDKDTDTKSESSSTTNDYTSDEEVSSNVPSNRFSALANL